MKQVKILLLVSMVMLFTACGGGGSSIDGGTVPLNSETKQSIAIDIIEAYADDNTNPAPTVQVYIDAGVSGVSADNIDNINTAVADLTAADVDTEEEIQALVDYLGIALPVDIKVPTLTLNGDNPQIVVQGDTYNEAGASAIDLVDGNLTSSIIIIENVETEIVGEYIVNYSVEDSDGNIASKNRVVNVVLPDDVTPPVITILGANPVEIAEGDSYTDEGATAYDARDGSTDVVVTSTVDSDNAGQYTVTYVSKDSAGNTATAVRNVNVSVAPDTTPPNITLNGDSNITIFIGRTYVEAGATANDDRDGDITVDIITEGTVDTNIAGVYTVTYSVSDSNENQSSVTRTINVVNKFTKDHNTNIVTNNETGLRWKDIIFEEGDWDNAVRSCGSSWRLPTRAEFKSIRLIDRNIFQTLDTGSYWTSEEIDGANTHYILITYNDIISSTSGKYNWNKHKCVNDSPLNTAPVANAGSDQNVNTSSTVTLDGSLSSDSDLDNLTYAWTITSQPEGSSTTLLDATLVNPTFTADVDGNYVLSLVVNDGTTDSIADTVTINATSVITYIGSNKWADMNQSSQALGDASLYCSNLVIGPYSNWELPSASLLQSLVGNDKIRNFNGEYWSSTYQNGYWLSVNSTGTTKTYVGYAIAMLNVICVSPN